LMRRACASAIGISSPMISSEVVLHCLGEFVVTACCGLPRPTGDLDVLLVLPSDSQAGLVTLAGRRSKLNKKHRREPVAAVVRARDHLAVRVTVDVRPLRVAMFTRGRAMWDAKGIDQETP
jgi:hypothetical protein